MMAQTSIAPFEDRQTARLVEPVESEYAANYGNDDSCIEEDEVDECVNDSFEDENGHPAGDESTIINLPTPTAMKPIGNLLSSEENFFIPQQTSPTLHRNLRKVSRTKAAATPSRHIKKTAKSKDIFYTNGSPTTIAPANLHYTMTEGLAPGTPSTVAGLASDFFGAANLGYLSSMSDDGEPMTTNAMMQFLDMSPEKTRKIKTRSAVLAVEEQPLSIDDLKPVPPKVGERNSPERPALVEDENTLNIRKLRRPSPSDTSDRSAKRIRSGSKSPMKKTIVPSSESSSYLQPEDEVFESKPAKPLKHKSHRESRRRRETSEFRQFSRELRDFSAINLNQLASLKHAEAELATMQQVQEDQEGEKLAQVKSLPTVLGTPAAKQIEGPPPATSPRRRNRPRRSLSVPPAPQIEVPGTLRKPTPITAQVNSIYDITAELSTTIQTLESDLSLAKRQLKTSQNSHEECLLQLRSESIARKRAEQVIAFLQLETKFMLEAAVAKAIDQTRAECDAEYKQHTAQSQRSQSRARSTRRDEVDDDTHSVSSARSIRSNDNKSTRRPFIGSTKRVDNATPSTRSRPDPIQRPNTTLGMYAAPTRSTRNQESQKTNSRVLAHSASANVMSREPETQKKGATSVVKTRTATAAKAGREQGPGGAMRPVGGRTGGVRR